MQLIHRHLNIIPIIKKFSILARFHKPVGILLLLWPTLWGLWLANKNPPNWFILTIFILGVIVMRAAGCVINDIADRDFDRYVKRTQNRPLTCGDISLKQAVIFFITLLFLACTLVLFLNPLTIKLALVGAILASIYPFLKRITYLPQLGLGLAFSWGIPMAFAATINYVPLKAWELFLAAIIWPIIYDTIYAMVDRSDDKKIGIKSTAILFAKYDKFIIGILQILFLGLLIHIGIIFSLNKIYFSSLILVSILFFYQQWLIRERNEILCFKAFVNNQWVGLIIFIGILLQ